MFINAVASFVSCLLLPTLSGHIVAAVFKNQLNTAEEPKASEERDLDQAGDKSRILSKISPFKAYQLSTQINVLDELRRRNVKPHRLINGSSVPERPNAASISSHACSFSSQVR